ncbi:hypothetical protein [uncultured Agrobacterium sp.]|uniref:hypothetical protein n=1 Tax=uncultured Agrobacterium sp. TaxID=157277 RepID=UPI0025F67155|nr:hypothetical protein [uncultured Agrobacterium sp.]
MTVSSEVSVAGPFYGNGSTRTFPYAFKILDARHIRAVLISASGDVSDLSLDNGDYSVTGIGSETGGDVIKTTPLLAGQTLTLVRRLPLTQETSLENQGAYYPEVVERRLDQMVMQIQSVKEATERSLTVEPGQEKPSMTQIAAAEGYAQGAKQSRDEASQFSSDAAGRVEEAFQAAGLSERWASAPENEEVVPGSGQYSALHQAKKAEAAKDSVIAGWSAAVRNAPLKATPSMADEFGFADSGDSWTIKKQTFAKLQEVFGLPIGGVMMMPGNGNNPPAGFLLMNGAPCTPAYPQLRAWLLSNGASTNGDGDPIIEDMGGYFPRGWRAGQLVDSGRVFGAVQQDALQNHRHPGNQITNATVSVAVNNNQYGPSPLVFDGYVNNPRAEANGHGAIYPDTASNSGVPRTASETRPINKTFTYWIKAYAADQVMGSAEFAALAGDVQGIKTTFFPTGDIVFSGYMAKEFGGDLSVALRSATAGFGNGQRWQDVQAFRSAGTSYQNTTSKPIVVSMGGSARYSFCEGQVSADNVNWLTPNRAENIYSSDTTYYYARPIFVVPSMHYYRLTIGNNYLGLTSWLELR